MLWENPECRANIQKTLPVFEDSQQLKSAMGVPLCKILHFGDGLLSEEAIDHLNQELKKIPVAKTEELQNEQEDMK